MTPSETWLAQRCDHMAAGSGSGEAAVVSACPIRPRRHGRSPPGGGRPAARLAQLRQLQSPSSWPQYLGAADFWNRTLQNWQSEMLAVASMAVLSVYLRQRGSPESKPVGASHDATGVEG